MMISIVMTTISVYFVCLGVDLLRRLTFMLLRGTGCAIKC